MNPIEQQLIEIETKISFQDDTIDKLNKVIIKQQKQIDLLEHKVSQLNIKLKEEINSQTDTPPQHEIPPHY